jgi:RNA polymerase sigma-70 factor (ECF subfamily)
MIEGISGFQWQGSTFASWLYRIAHNQVIDFVRQRTRRPQTPLEPLGDVLHTDEDEPHRRAEQSDFSDHLGAAIRSLTDLQAHVIVLRFGAGLTNAQVAETLGRTEGAVKALQYSGLQNLNKALRLKGWGDEQQAAGEKQRE